MWAFSCAWGLGVCAKKICTCMYGLHWRNRVEDVKNVCNCERCWSGNTGSNMSTCVDDPSVSVWKRSLIFLLLFCSSYFVLSSFLCLFPKSVSSSHVPQHQ